MREALRAGYSRGAFAQEWKREQERGAKTLEALRNEALESPMSRAEESVIALVQKAHAL